MSSELKLRRGSTAAHTTFTGADGEVTFDTDKNVIVSHDGATVGGFPHTKAADLAASSGASLVGTKLPYLNSKQRTQESRNQDTRSILDFIDSIYHSDIRAGTSTYDAATRINYAMSEMGPGELVIPSGCRVAIAAPIDIVRGVLLRGRGTFDDINGVGTKIYLLPGSNCSMLRTPAAVSGQAFATHFMGVENICFDANGIFQTVMADAVQFWGAYIGSWLEKVFIKNSFGSALTLDGGADINIRHLWITGSTVGVDKYAFDTNQTLVVGSIRSGLLNMDHIYIENTAIDYASVSGAPRTVIENRGKAVRFQRISTLNVGEIHIEATNRPVTITSCQSFYCGKISASYVGDDALSDNTIVLMEDANTPTIKIGQILCPTGNTANLYALKKKAGLTSNFLPDSRLHTQSGMISASNGYSAHIANTTVDTMSGPSGFRDRVTAYYGNSQPRFRLVTSKENADAAQHEYIKGSNGVLEIGTTYNIAGQADSSFIKMRGDTTDMRYLRLEILQPAIVAVRETNNLPHVAGAIFRPNFPGGSGFAMSTGNSMYDNIALVKQVAAAPSASAVYVGQIHVDTSASPRQAYIAVSVGSGAADWRQLTV